MGITAFTANFKGGARPTLFRVQQTFPAVAVAGIAARQFEFLCKGAQLPGSQVNAIPVYYQGRPIKTPGDREFEPMTLTIINDVDFAIRSAYERWLNAINGHESNLGSVDPALIWSDMSITQLGRDGAPLETYTLFGAFPTLVSAIDLDFGSVDTVEEFQVTLEYQGWGNSAVSFV